MLTKLGFGAMRLPYKDGDIDQQKVNEMVKYAIENGINYFDTSLIYHDGKSEVSLGIALEPFKRESYFLADKMSFWLVNSEEDLDKLFNTSCERLKTDYIDYYLMHSMTKEMFAKVKNLKAIEWALQKKKEGKIKHLGFSIHDDYDCLVDILNEHDWEFAQIQYNYMDLDDNPGKKGYDELVKRNIPIVVMEPLKGGALSNIPEHIATPFSELGKSNASFSFRWLAEQKGINIILSGMSDLNQLKENIELFKNISPLNEEEHQAILKVKENLKQLQKVNCTGCSYCMPCPIGITIPELFRSWNMRSMMKTHNWISGVDINKSLAEKCVECGKCMSHCPQNINIPEKLKQLVAE